MRDVRPGVMDSGMSRRDKDERDMIELKLEQAAARERRSSTSLEIERNQRGNEFLKNSIDREYVAAASKQAEEERRAKKAQKAADRDAERSVLRTELDVRKQEAENRKAELDAMKAEQEREKKESLAGTVNTIRSGTSRKEKIKAGAKYLIKVAGGEASRAGKAIPGAIRQARFDVASQVPGGVRRESVSGIRARGIQNSAQPADMRFGAMNMGMNNFAVMNGVSTPLSRSRARPVQQAPQPLVNPLTNFTSTVLMGGNHQRKSAPKVGTVNANAMQNLTNVMMGNTTKKNDSPLLNDKNPRHLQKDFMGSMLFGGNLKASPKKGGGAMRPPGVDLKKFNQQMLLGSTKPIKRKPGHFGGMI